MPKKFLIAATIIFSGLLLFNTTAVFAASLNEEVSFSASIINDYYSRDRLSATLKWVSERGYFYVDQKWFNGLNSSQQNQVLVNIEDLARDFDQIIYPKLTQDFGDIWSPGVDEDVRVTVLVERMIDEAGGYVNPENEYPKSEVASSNEREMIYLNGNFVLLNLRRAKSFLAHELQHLITFYQKDKLRNAREDVWLNEARSEYASTFLGFDDDFSGSNLQSRVETFLSNPSDSLTEWKNGQYDYGSVNLFAQYLVNHYGGQTIIQAMLSNDKVGIASVNDALSRLGYGVDFSRVFTDWTIANYLNNCGIKVEYCYQNPVLDYKNFHIRFNSIIGSGDSMTAADTVKDWAAAWYEITPASSPDKTVLELSFSSDAPSGIKFKVPYIIQYGNGKVEVKFMNLLSNKDKVYIGDFGTDVIKVAVAPSAQTKMENFSDSEPSYAFNFGAQVLDKAPAIPNYPDGTLIRAENDYKVYVVNGRYKRWIQNGGILDFYGHLLSAPIIVVTPEERDWYHDSLLIRQDGDYKIYEVWTNGTKHWLNMTPERFLAAGKKFEQVYVVNEKEKIFYYTGEEIY